MRQNARLTAFDKLFFILIALCSLIAMSSMTAWLVLTIPTPEILLTVLDTVDPQTLIQPELQYGRGHTMTNTAGIHGQAENIIWFAPVLFFLALTNMLIWTWFYTTRVRIKARRKIQLPISKKLIPNPSSA